MIEDILDNISPKTLLAGTLVIYTLVRTVQWLDEERRIRALGGHTRKVRTYLPFGVDMVIKAVYNTMHHQNLEGWRKFFSGDSYTVEGRPAGQRIILTADVENIKAILATQFQDFGKGEDFHKDWSEFLGDSIFTTDSEKWHASRQLIRPQFIKDRVSDLEVFEEHVQILIKAIANGGVKGAPGVATDGIGKGRLVDVSDLFFRYTLDAATDFLLGHSVGSLEIPIQDFAEAFSEVQRVQNIIARAGLLNWLVPRKTFRSGLKLINEFVNPFIERTLRLSPDELATQTKSESGYTFLHALASFTRDRKILRDQLVAVLLAGRDTTASTLSWTFYELAKHPEAWEALRKEVLETVGRDRIPTYDDLKSMKYLQHVMNETLRIYPVVPFNVRVALKDTTLPRGGGPDGLSPFGILAGTPIAYSPLVMQRRQDIYPPSFAADPTLDAEYFKPERWENWQPRPWTYIPFNGGPRICIGQQFALTEMGYTIVRLCQRFAGLEFRMPEGVKGSPVLKAEIVLQPGDGVRVGFYDDVKA